MLDHKRIFEAVLPGEVWWQSYICGGYAFNPHLADDIDIWITQSNDGVEESVNHFLNAVAGFADVRRRDDLGSSYDDYNLDNATVEKAVVRAHGIDKRIHLMMSSLDIIGVLETFDISIHQLALHFSGAQVFGSQFTPITEPPKVLHYKVPYSTWNRYHKLCDRYNFKPDPDVCRELKGRMI